MLRGTWHADQVPPGCSISSMPSNSAIPVGDCWSLQISNTCAPLLAWSCVILFFPSHNCSRFTKPSKFSIVCIQRSGDARSSHCVILIAPVSDLLQAPNFSDVSTGPSSGCEISYSRSGKGPWCSLAFRGFQCAGFCYMKGQGIWYRNYKFPGSALVCEVRNLLNGPQTRKLRKTIQTGYAVVIQI